MSPSRSGTRGGRARGGPASARRRLNGIADLLEGEFGRPRRRADPDLVGSLVQTILSQNTTDTNSGRAYLELRERIPTWGEVRRANVRSIEAAIRGGGLARTKARRIKEILAEIERETGGIDLGFLRTMETEAVVEYLKRFRGVGSKTAACVALFDLDREIMPVDTHIHRVAGRLGIVGRPRDREATYRALAGIVPEGRSLSLHVNLIRLGRAYCRPAKPRCEACPIRRRCDHGRGRPSAPRAGRRAPAAGGRRPARTTAPRTPAARGGAGRSRGRS
jgi:endonuclease-3